MDSLSSPPEDERCTEAASLTIHIDRAGKLPSHYAICSVVMRIHQVGAMGRSKVIRKDVRCPIATLLPRPLRNMVSKNSQYAELYYVFSQAPGDLPT